MKAKESMEVISFRVPKRLKDQMKSVNANWGEEVRKLIENNVKRHRKRKALEDAMKLLKETPSAPAGTAARYIREDRDSR
jgi:antitoxin component of MazEF toxin-antitoxin module